MMKRKIHSVAVCTCCAFTIQVLAFTILPPFFKPVVNELAIQQTFILALLASISVVLITSFDFRRVWVGLLISYVVLMMIVLGIGSFVFHLIPVDIRVYISVILVGVIVYLGTFFLVFYKNKADADQINQKLGKKRNEDGTYY